MDLSVICPVFDSPPALLRAAALSVLAAGDGRAVSELVLVDDKSTDTGTLHELNRLASEPRIRLVRQERNSGPASARNRGITEARTEWIGFIDADDLWLPGRIEAARLMLARTDTDWIGGRHVTLGRDGSMGAVPGIAEAVGDGPVAAGPGLTRALIANFWMHLGSILVKRELALRAGGFAEGLRYYEDFLFLAKLSVLAPLHRLDADVYAWRRAGAGLTASPARLAPDSMRMHRLAARDPLLRGFRRELRWARYSARKGLALNNLVAGNRGRALGLALDAYRLDPREIGDLLAFLRLWSGDADGVLAGGRRYSATETFPVQDAP